MRSWIEFTKCKFNMNIIQWKKRNSKWFIFVLLQELCARCHICWAIHRLPRGDIQFIHQDTGTTFNELVVGHLHIDHFIPFDTAKLNHDRSGDHIQHQLLSSSCFHACTAGNYFGTHNDLNRIVDIFAMPYPDCKWDQWSVCYVLCSVS